VPLSVILIAVPERRLPFSREGYEKVTGIELMRRLHA
jgi:hypothetical protein